ncbi:MAG: hypothetical protein JW940_02910 [Polyangiaceae bacterium]|nr:hypothetical protein [Polyangiaceae bacterium]
MRTILATRFVGATIGAVGAMLFLVGCESNGPHGKDELRTTSGALTADASGKAKGKAKGTDQEALSRAAPKAQLYVRGGRVMRLYGAVMATGTTPETSAEVFRKNVTDELGADPDDLVRVGTPAAHAAAASKSDPAGLMLDPETGTYGFWLYQYDQVRSGIPVHGASLLALVQNVESNPVVWAGASLRDLGDLAVPRHRATPSADPTKSLQALRQLDPIGLLPSELELGEPELVVFAGADSEEIAPRLAGRYLGSSDDPLGKWRFIADAATGDILHVEDMLAAANIGGRVMGRATQGAMASECAPEVTTPLRYADTSITGISQGYTTSQGYFYLFNPGTTPVTVVSPVGGRRFDIFDFAGSTETLTLTVTPPSYVYFTHNQSNTDEYVRAQVNAYVFANQTRDFLLSYLPGYATIATEEDFPVNVNRNDYGCPGNAWYDSASPSINFCRADWLYTNTAYGSFVQHEYAHHIIHVGAGLTGSGGPYGEGMADSIAVSSADDPRLFQGVLKNNCSYVERSADNTCQYSATACSNCGDYSDEWGCGQLLSGIIWDIRERLMVTHPTDYRDIANRLMLSSIALHAGLTSIGPEILASFLTLDDDDGNPSNGTPHRTEICEGFAAHGIPCAALPGPCASFCSDPLVFTWGGDYQSGPLGTGTICRQTTHPVAGGNCGNFSSSRKLYLNGTQMPCDVGNWSTIPPAVNGGYCVTTTAGDYSYAFFTLW